MSLFYINELEILQRIYLERNSINEYRNLLLIVMTAYIYLISPIPNLSPLFFLKLDERKK
jgi:hypothetical protein